MLSVIIPAFNEEEMVGKTFSVISDILSSENIPFELIFVDGGNSDGAWGKLQALPAMIDGDLQHPPQKIVEMYRLWEDGYEIIEAVKSDRGKESLSHKMAAGTFYRIISRSTGINMSRASDFKLLDRKAVLAILNMKEKQAFFRALSSWVGLKKTQIKFEVQEREAGESKWSAKSLIKYALTNITSFSSAPMQIVTRLGVVMFIVMLAFGGIAIYQKIAGIALGGFTTVILLLLFIGSIMMISLGIIGYYIAKFYDEVKARPRYIRKGCSR